jgi:hypothetical protein
VRDVDREAVPIVGRVVYQRIETDVDRVKRGHLVVGGVEL